MSTLFIDKVDVVINVKREEWRICSKAEPIVPNLAWLAAFATFTFWYSDWSYCWSCCLTCVAISFCKFWVRLFLKFLMSFFMPSMSVGLCLASVCAWTVLLVECSTGYLCLSDWSLCWSVEIQLHFPFWKFGGVKVEEDWMLSVWFRWFCKVQDGVIGVASVYNVTFHDIGICCICFSLFTFVLVFWGMGLSISSMNFGLGLKNCSWRIDKLISSHLHPSAIWAFMVIIRILASACMI